MTKKSVLIVEDEEDILKLLEITLNREGFVTTGVANGLDAIKLVKSRPYDLVLLDLMLPGMDGIEVCRNLRKNETYKDLPIIMLTARGEESDIVKGLECGADDYITKPFSPKILLARMKTVLKRRGDVVDEESSVVSVHDLYIHPEKYQVFIKNKPLKLTSAEFKVLHLMASKPGWVFSRYNIIDEIRGEDYAVTDRSVDVLMVGLRKKLGRYGSYVETVRGVGYRFKSV